ncbi:MAG: hypothetical protein ACLVJ6_01835 [Merdibacter sp.]
MGSYTEHPVELFLPFETWFATEETQSVAAIAFEEVGDHRYHNGSNEP